MMTTGTHDAPHLLKHDTTIRLPASTEPVGLPGGARDGPPRVMLDVQTRPPGGPR